MRSHGVAPCGEDLGHAGDLQPLLGGAERGAKARAPGADDDDVVFVIDDFVVSHRSQNPKPAGSGAEPSASRTMKKTLAAASARKTRFSRPISRALLVGTWM